MVQQASRIYFSPAYHLAWDGHVFPAGKYAALAARVVAEGLLGEEELCCPAPLVRSQLLMGHDPEYLDRLEGMVADPDQGYLEFEAPASRSVLDAFYAMAGGSLAAARAALSLQGCGDGFGGFAANLGGGFHHAFPWKGEGFCAINDIVVTLRILLDEGAIGRGAVVDLDVHQGNGTAKAFEGEERVFTFSMHQEDNYPVKQRSDLDIGLPNDSGDRLYLEELAPALETVRAQKPDLVVYVAGADPFVDDLLGGLALSKEGLARRDEAVFKCFLPQGIAVVAVLAGGYAQREEDVVDIHLAMLRTGLRMAR